MISIWRQLASFCFPLPALTSLPPATFAFLRGFPPYDKYCFILLRVYSPFTVQQKIPRVFTCFACYASLLRETLHTLGSSTTSSWHEAIEAVMGVHQRAQMWSNCALRSCMRKIHLSQNIYARSCWSIEGCSPNICGKDSEMKYVHLIENLF